nr:phosphotransferase [uncultured Acetatifactor sp.]
MLIFPYCPSSPAAPPSASEVKMLTAQCREALRDVGGMPIFFDLSSGDRMISQTESACLSALGSGGQALRPLFHWMETRIPRLYAGQPIGIIHGDFNVSNLITEGGDLRYILGWQRPMLAPLALEQALALRLAGYESEDGDWGKFATVCHILWHAWTYTHVLPIEGVRQMALKLADGFVSPLAE